MPLNPVIQHLRHADKPHGVIFPITEVQVKYKNSCTFDDEFEVQTIIIEFSRAKMDFAYKVIRLAYGVVLVEGTISNFVSIFSLLGCFLLKQRIDFIKITGI